MEWFSSFMFANEVNIRTILQIQMHNVDFPTVNSNSMSFSNGIQCLFHVSNMENGKKLRLNAPTTSWIRQSVGEMRLPLHTETLELTYAYMVINHAYSRPQPRFSRQSKFDLVFKAFSQISHLKLFSVECTSAVSNGAYLGSKV